MPMTNKKDVLLAEPADEERFRLLTLLQQGNLTCDVAAEGKEAILLLKTNRYAVVLLDASIPSPHAEQIVRELGKSSADERPIIFLTSSGQPGEQPMADLAGDLVQALVRKPFDAKDLSEILIGCVRTRQGREGSAPDSSLFRRV